MRFPRRFRDAGDLACLAGLKHLTALEQLESLALPGDMINDESLVHLLALQHLELFELLGPNITAQGMAVLRDLPRNMNFFDAALETFLKIRPNCRNHIGHPPCMIFVCAQKGLRDWAKYVKL